MHLSASVIRLDIIDSISLEMYSIFIILNIISSVKINFTVSLTYLTKSIHFSIAKTMEVIFIRILNDIDIP